MSAKRNCHLSVLITHEERKILDQFAERFELPVSRVISWLIRMYLSDEMERIIWPSQKSK